MNVIGAIKRAAWPATIVVALVAFSPSAYAQAKPTKAALATAEELIKITGAIQFLDPLIPGVIEQAKILFLQQDPALAPDLNEIAAKMRTDLKPRFSEVTTEVATLYASHFSEWELKQIVTFYQSPVGKKVLSQQPVVIDASMKFAQTWANKLSDEVVAKMREELKKKGHAL